MSPVRCRPLRRGRAARARRTRLADWGFPDAPRLELDQLLVQLRDRAIDVLATQGRLRGLLRANALVAGELSVPLVLRQIMAAARDLLGARYAALGVLGRDGGLEQFVHAGRGQRCGGVPDDHVRSRRIPGAAASAPAVYDVVLIRLVMAGTGAATG